MDRRGAWSRHNWLSRTVNNGSDKAVIHHHCFRCQRDFVEDQSIGRYAVNVSVFRFQKLADPISKRWITGFCPGEALTQDLADRKELAT